METATGQTESCELHQMLGILSAYELGILSAYKILLTLISVPLYHCTSVPL